MSVEYDKDTDEAEVDCFRGVCELENEFGKKVMTDEQKSTSTKDKEPSKPVFLDDDEKQELLDLPEVKKKDVQVPTPEVVPPTLTPTPKPIDTPEPAREEVIVPTATPVVLPAYRYAASPNRYPGSYRHARAIAATPRHPTGGNFTKWDRGPAARAKIHAGTDVHSSASTVGGKADSHCAPRLRRHCVDRRSACSGRDGSDCVG